MYGIDLHPLAGASECSGMYASWSLAYMLLFKVTEKIVIVAVVQSTPQFLLCFWCQVFFFSLYPFFFSVTVDMLSDLKSPFLSIGLCLSAIHVDFNCI